MKPLIVANWKMNPSTLKEAETLFNLVKKGIKDSKKIEVVICPPFVYLPLLSSIIGHRPSVKFGSQDCFWENPSTGGGAFTGEVSPLMLKNLGVEYVIIGHSERRKYQRETNEIIKKKLEAVSIAGLKPILCINKISQLPSLAKQGEDRDEANPRRSPKKIKGGFIVAYEPLFAIGTGKACSPEKAKKMKLLIKKRVNVPVLYGGSVNSQNAKDYFEKAGFQGLLVGSASLNPKEFIGIIKNVS